MPPSQLKRLKASLREQGVTGPQRSKKQKTRAADDRASKDRRVARNAALEGIRDHFNPFEVKQQARPTKFAVANGSNRNGPVVGRPGVTRGLGEETRKKTLLKEMQRRKKVGGIVDRRFGENDPTMTPEERALQRFVKEQERGKKNVSIFDLEDEDGDPESLTHLGRSLSFTQKDDFEESGVSGSEDGDVDAESTLRATKRRRISNEGDDGHLASEEEAQPEKSKTKQEVMKEVIAKSKLYKHERQKAKEDDDELRAELDGGLQDIYTLLRGKPPAKPAETREKPAAPQMDPDRLALLEGKDRDEADKEYDTRIRQLALGARSQPTARTKTEEERATEEAEHLQRLEEERLQRMRGEDFDRTGASESGGDDHLIEEEAAGLGAGIPVHAMRKPLEVEDEDDFILDDVLAASDSEAEVSSENNNLYSESADDSDEADKEFIADLLTEEDTGRPDLKSMVKPSPDTNDQHTTSGLAFTYSCPQTHTEWLQIVNSVPQDDLPTAVQRIRALYHPKLASTNKDLLAKFSKVLVEHISHMANQSSQPSFKTIESLIRHIHSLSRSFPSEVSMAFRKHLRGVQERPGDLEAGDLIIFTAIGTIFPTSDHFHQVVTPSILSMARYLGQKIPQSIADLAKGLYICTLCVDYQHLSKRYIPELVNYLQTTLEFVSPTKPASDGPYPRHDSSEALRIGKNGKGASAQRSLRFWDIDHAAGFEDEAVKSSLLRTAVGLIEIISELWEGKTAYAEIFEPFVHALDHYSSKGCRSFLSQPDLVLVNHVKGQLSIRLAAALRNRRWLELHHHRPLAIKTAIPKFEEGFHPDKHYDPDRDRAELRKLKAEHKREKKGALRELRKDASFMAREQLRDKKERDEVYERKQRRLIAEIQGEEGKEKNAYEREKRARKGRK